MAKQQLTGTINLKDVQEIDPGQRLKVAVARNCRVIQSVVLEAKANQQTVNFRLAFDPGAKKPLGVTVLVGPDVPDDRLRSVEHQAQRLPASAFRDQQAKVELAVTDRLYRFWLGLCRTYRIRGRVVCRRLRWDPIEQQFVPCESPVRGALVTARDVDRLWWWCRTDTVGSDYTDLNGNFEITFRWCCWWWGPWLVSNWRLDPAVVQRIKDLARAATPSIPIPPPRPELDLGLFESLAGDIAAARADAPGTEAAFAAPERVLDLGRQVAAHLPAAPDLQALHVWPWWPIWDCKPDIIFDVTQDCGDGEKLVYHETCADTRWDIPTDLSGVVLVANAEACCAPCCTQPPDEDCLVFDGVGCGGYPVTAIEQDLASSLVGYAQPGSNDRPFGRTLRLLAMFGDDSTVDFYKLQTRRRLTVMPETWTPWTDVPADQITAFTRSHWLGFPPPFWKPQTVAPELIDGQTVLRTTRRFRLDNPDIVDTVDPTNDDWLALWKTADIHTNPAGQTIETPLIADGLYEVRVVGYDYDAGNGTLTNQRIMPLCPGENDPVDPADHAGIRLRIDNRNAISSPGTVNIDTEEPASDFPDICAVVKNEGEPDQQCVSVCGVLPLKAGDTLTVHFQASDADGHLEAYSLNAHWAESDVFNMLVPSVGTIEGDPDPLFGPNYAHTFVGDQGMERAGRPASDPEHDRPFWYGGHFKVTVTVGDPVPLTTHHVFETCCAYLLRLKVWKRTTNGCTSSQYFHVNWSEFSFTIVRTDLPCAAGLLPAPAEG